MQAGLSYLGGARPPPQSGKSQSSPVPGTYQISSGPDTLLVQPTRLVRARATVLKSALSRTALRYMLRSGS